LEYGRNTLGCAPTKRKKNTKKEFLNVRGSSPGWWRKKKKKKMHVQQTKTTTSILHSFHFHLTRLSVLPYWSSSSHLHRSHRTAPFSAMSHLCSQKIPSLCIKIKKKDEGRSLCSLSLSLLLLCEGGTGGCPCALLMPLHTGNLNNKQK